ncbi:MAG: hypothetical protein H7834_08245 [Magnetococcus sp. YQC-9]
MRLAWLGRLEGFKIPILLHTIRRLEAITDLRLELDILGDGADEAFISNSCADLRKLKIRMLGKVAHDELDERLSTYHLLFAMGTSALEGARLGLPTFCLDYSYESITKVYRYRLLHECVGYNVGEQITEAHYEPFSTLERRLGELIDRYAEESGLAHAYWRTHHAPEAVLEKFITAIDGAQCSFAEIASHGLGQRDFVTQWIDRFAKSSGGVNAGFQSR